MSERASNRALPPARREGKDVRLGFMLGLFGLIAATAVLMLAIAYLVFPGEVQDKRFSQPFPRFPDPVLQPSPQVDMDAFRAEEMGRLNGAGWQDRAAGKVHIPIDQAMRAVAAEGISGWPARGDAAASQGDRR